MDSYVCGIITRSGSYLVLSDFTFRIIWQERARHCPKSKYDKARIYFWALIDTMRGSRKFCQKGSKSDNVFFFFFLMRGKRAYSYSCLLFRRSWPVLLRNPIFLWFSGGGGSRPPVPPLDPHMDTTNLGIYWILHNIPQLFVLFLGHLFFMFNQWLCIKAFGRRGHSCTPIPCA